MVLNPLKPPLNIFLIGNNPVDIAVIHEQLKSIKQNKVNPYFAFDLNNILSRISKTRPASIIIDDTLGIRQLTRFVKKLRRNKKTRQISIMLLKSSNHDCPVSNEVDELLLKEDISRDKLYHGIINSFKFRKRKYPGY